MDGEVFEIFRFRFCENIGFRGGQKKNHESREFARMSARARTNTDIIDIFRQVEKWGIAEGIEKTNTNYENCTNIVSASGNVWRADGIEESNTGSIEGRKIRFAIRVQKKPRLSRISGFAIQIVSIT